MKPQIVPVWAVRRMSAPPSVIVGCSSPNERYKVPFTKVYCKTASHWLAMCLQCHVVARLLKVGENHEHHNQKRKFWKFS